MSDDAQAPTLLDWIFRVFAAIGPIAAVSFGYILRTNASRVESIEIKQEALEAMANQSRIDIKDTEISMKTLQIHITENFCNKADIQASLARVHEKIEDGNEKTDKLAENMGNKIDQLRRDLQDDIRSAMALAASLEPAG